MLFPVSKGEQSKGKQEVGLGVMPFDFEAKIGLQSGR
jgi:hypothetical protein